GSTGILVNISMFVDYFEKKKKKEDLSPKGLKKKQVKKSVYL
nr:cell division protein FtsW [Bacillus pacificus]